MRQMIKKCLSLGLVFGLSACTTVDDYLLGKDNTPSPTPLEKIKPEMAFSKKWTVPVGAGKSTDGYLKINPVAKGNRLFTASHSGQVQAFEKSNGHIVWTQTVPGNIVSGPTVSDGIVVIATDSAMVIALKEQDGSMVWKSHVSGDVLAKPLIHQDKVIAKTVDGNVFALNRVNGKQLWVASHGAPNIILKASSSPVILNNNIMLVGHSDGKMDAIDLRSGNVIWSRGMAYALGSSDVERLVDIDADPVVQGNIVYLAGYQGYIGALSLTNGDFIWKKPASTYKNIVLNNNTLYMTDSSDVVWALNKSTGQVLWKQVDLKARGLTEPVVWGNHIVVGDKLGFVHVLSSQTGNITSRATLSGPVLQAPLLSSNTLFVQSANGLLTRLAVS